VLMPPLELLVGSNLDGKELQRCYKASTDGWSALDFHRQVDTLGSVLVIGQNEDGVLLGGYNPVGWDSRDDYRATPRAFLFCAPPAVGESEPEWQTCAVLGPGDVAIFDYARGGPQFGAADLVIGPPQTPVMGGLTGPDNYDEDYMKRTAGDLRYVSATPGSSYARLPGGAAFPSGTLVELEAYCNAAFATGSGLRIGTAKAPGDDDDSTPLTAGWWPFKF